MNVKEKYKPPTTLKKLGKETWWRIWSILETEEKADANDPIAVEMIAFNYLMYREMAIQIKKEGMTFVHTNQGGSANLAKHPLISELPKSMDQLRKYLGELGLTGASRKRLQEQLVREAEDGFDDF